MKVWWHALWSCDFLDLQYDIHHISMEMCAQKRASVVIYLPVTS